MSHSEDIYISYYSAVLAKALKVYDELTFNSLFEIISTVSDPEKAAKAKERAFEISKLPLITLSSKISWLEKLGVEPVTLPEMESLTGSKNKYATKSLPNSVNTKIESKEHQTTSNTKTSNVSELNTLNNLKENRQSFDLSSFKYIDENESKLSSSEDCLIENDFKETSNATKHFANDTRKTGSNQGDCIIEINELSTVKDESLTPYNTSTKTFYTEEDLCRDQLQKSDPKFTEAGSKLTGSLEESKKKRKKKKKSKPKGDPNGDASLKPANAAKVDENYVSESQEMSEYSETTPLLPESKNKKQVKNANNLPTSTSQANKKPSDKKSLCDKSIKELLIILGDEQSKSGNPKKAKDSKASAAKKEKKKLKKQKRADKKKAMENHETSDVEEVACPPKPEVVEEKSTISEPAVNEVDDNSDEFITQRRKKMSHKHPVSGRASPYKSEPTRKRRFSDPSPSVSSDQQAPPSQAIIFPCPSEKRNWKAKDGEKTSNEVYDRSNQVQWPTLPSQSDLNGAKGNNGSGSASYASKLKMNMDSTGCSLASSSEETSSSSSSTNNFHSRSSDRASPLHDPLHALTDISKYINEAAGFVRKSSCTLVSHQLNACPRVDNVEPLPVVHNVIEAKLSCNNEVSSKLNKDASCFQAKSATVESDQLSDTHLNKSSIHPDCNLLTSGSKDSSSNPDKSGLQDELVSKLKNIWGLDFFVGDLSNQTPTLAQPEMAVTSTDNISELVFFGDAKLPVDAMTSDMEIQNQRVLPNFHFQTDCKDWSDSGDFDVKKATALLLDEWKKALKKGTFYKDL